MTRKDFALIAHTIQGLPSHSENLRAYRASVANAFADMLGAQNVRFNRTRFLEACGIGDLAYVLV